jgi:hypothetical protein
MNTNVLNQLTRVALGLLLSVCFGSTDTRAAPPAPRSALGMNLAGVRDWSQEIVFVDVFKASRTWISQQRGQPWGKGPPLELDDHGWVKSLKDGQFAETVVFTDFGDRFPAGTYTCLYEGEGDVDLTGDARVTNREPGKLQVEIQPKNGSAFLRITRTDPNNYVRNIRLIMPGHEKTCDSQPFYPEFLKRWSAFKVIRFMDWQETNGSELRDWSERPTPADQTQARQGVSLEFMIQLCNTLDADPWFCLPHLASDEYVREFAAQVLRDLKPSLKVYVEYSNECWNGQFAQARYCADEGKKCGLSNNAYEGQLRYYSQRSGEIFGIWEATFGGDERLVRVLATQSANPWTGTTALDWQDAYKRADAIAIAPYFGNELGDPKQADENAQLSVGEVLDRCEQSIAGRRETTRKYAEEAKKRGLALIAYEGGQHLVGHGGAENNQELTKLLQTANRHPRMKELYLQDLRGWRESGGGLMCVFSSMGNYSKWGSWGVLENGTQNVADAPKYQALLEFLRENE